MVTKNIFSLVVATTLLTPAAADAGCPVPGFKYAAFGQQSMQVNGGATTNSYDSSAGTYAQTKVSSGGNLGTNSTANPAITVSGGSIINGNIDVGFGGNPNTGVTVSNNSSVASKASLSAALTLSAVTVPSLTAASPSAPSSGTLAPNKKYGNISCNGNNHLTVNAGTYVMSGLDLNGQCDLIVASGPVEIYITGTAMHLNGGSVANSSLKSTDLVFYSNTLTDVELNGGTNAAFAMYAPNAQVKINGNADIYGSIVGKSFEINGGAKVHYDNALGNLNTSAISCASGEVSRATPILATVGSQSCIVQGTFEPTTGTATTITSTTDVSNFVFPHIQGHVRARVTSSITTTASTFSSGTILFDAGTAIPTVTVGGCALGANSNFTTSCRNVFTNTNTTPTNGVTTFSGTPSSRITMFNNTDANATAIGGLIAPAGTGANQVPNITLTHWKTIVARVLAGTSNGTVAKLGGVDRSTVAVIGPSSVAGVSTRPTMTYFGGTDGMLHAVCTSTGGTTGSASNICPSTLAGTELWAFLPRVQLPLVRVNKQRIDGSVRVVDAFGAFPDPTTGVVSDTKTWRTILTFQTGYSDSTFGGKPAVYALDVTDPAKPILLWEATTPSTTGAQLGAGLAMHAGPTLVSNTITNLAIAQTNNGGSGGAGIVLNAFSLETGTPKWTTPFSYIYAGPRPSTNSYDGGIPATGVPGGAIGVDLAGKGFTSDVVMGDLFGNLWRVDAATGTSSTRLFSYSTDKHPIGALPALLDKNGIKVAVFGTGGYADPSGATSWTTTNQKLLGVKVNGTSTLDESSSALALNLSLTGSSDKVAAQVLVVGTEVFVTTDTSDINASTYGTNSTATGTAYSYNTAGSSQTLTLVNTLQGGASSLALNKASSTVIGGASSKTQQLANTATTVGVSVDYQSTSKSSRMVWLSARR